MFGCVARRARPGRRETNGGRRTYPPTLFPLASSSKGANGNRNGNDRGGTSASTGALRFKTTATRRDVGLTLSDCVTSATTGAVCVPLLKLLFS